MSSIEFHIEELVLHGFVLGDCYRIAEAVQCELRRLLTAQGVPPLLAHEGEIVRLDGGAFPIAPSAHPEVVGTQVAQAVYGGLRQ